MPIPIKLNQLRIFIEIRHHGNIQAASRFLSLSQPALTKSIRELDRLPLIWRVIMQGKKKRL
ncbi:LysR family transcriptional regulator [Xenorhabdus sp. 42]|uniref:LysR family transcriptional regulator n=1 Tax=Xenorhabdus szentirmaii TaxID=290112 RepID=A0AAW3Z192_9GAMM|nr:MULTISPECIES: LysR family transcriptional regulator [Xenorhabdus]MBD2780895.1 LysR family transcriptional regulator [Xenorhabdus sp. 38]MBD2792583.1 LysR family transcriptional regulator [Xenorhabdus sp. CUL]MBD2802757.1 LysR family transcriptional regulator [Xenorhabdus sp. M]MBD2803592.1 LysR family transcriptional regulator [Xenorhabdus sp. ZM]MBD2822466.1 LysR family transcriptional regulator [Xenorhabdus sp. 42]